MFRFYVRDLLWLMLVVALGLGWMIGSRQLRAELERESTKATKWRMAAGALERVFRDEGWDVTWKLDEAKVLAERKTESESSSYLRAIELHEPSARDD